MRSSIDYTSGAGGAKPFFISYIRIARHVSYVTCRATYVLPVEVLPRGEPEANDDEPVRRRISALHLRALQPVRARTTGFALHSVKTCRWMRSLAENDGIGRRVASISILFSFLFFTTSCASLCSYGYYSLKTLYVTWRINPLWRKHEKCSRMQ